MARDNIRNFCIIAHIDHGKSTLSDRILELTKSVDERIMEDQILDNMDIERERGITIKARAVTLNYTAKDGKTYEFNLIDTPGHVDFAYEVSRSLAACEGAILVVDATQGVEAQTLANTYMALEHDLELVPILNKIDLPSAHPDEVAQEVEDVIGLPCMDAPRVSAKTGLNVDQVLERVVSDIPAPTGDPDAPLKALIFDSIYDSYKGVIVYIRVFEGTVKPGDTIKMMATGAEFTLVEVGHMGATSLTPCSQLQAGEVGYLTASIKTVQDTRVGDTVTLANDPTPEALPGYRQVKPMVFCGIYPADGAKYPDLKDALEKLQLGQFIMIREGTAAQNLRALLPLLNQQYYSRCMFATDDKHPLDLLQGGHIDYIIREAIACGVDPIIAIKVASHQAARYFLMNNKGAIAPGYLADLVVFDNFRHFNIQEVYKRGRCVFADGEVLPFDAPAVEPSLSRRAHETFRIAPVTPQQLAAGDLPVIGIVPGEIITQNLGRAAAPDPTHDILKIAVAERHHGTGHIGLGYIKGYGLRQGAVATSFAHDSHNIIAVGADDADLAFAINRIAEMQGGTVVVHEGKVIAELPLPVAGLMSDAPLEEVNDLLEQAKAAAHRMGVSPGIDPFMTLSFMSLPVIPALKITTHGVFDVEQWKYI